MTKKNQHGTFHLLGGRGFPTVEELAKLSEAITGRKVTPEELAQMRQMGEREGVYKKGA